MRTTILFLTLLMACTQTEETSQVVIKGNLHSMMMEGKTGAVVTLADLDREHLYALGAMEKLSGEITIIDGESINTQVAEDTFKLNNDANTKATLLVYARVKEWEQIPLKANQDIVSLETILDEQVAIRKIAQPFPFMISGSAATIDWHIVNGGGHDHKRSGHSQKSLFDQPQLLGFFSTEHQGVFTHRGLNSHIHFTSADKLSAGHVDELEITNSSILFVPKSYQP